MLRSVRLSGSEPGPTSGHPFDLPALRGVEEIELRAPVTFFVGENGSGKSTLLEALAVATELPTVGSAPAHRDPTLAAAAKLAATLSLGWSRRLQRGFFIRAEDVFGFILALRRQRAEIEGELAEMSRRMEGASEYARGLALGPHRSSLADMTRRYGENPDARSHGETFLHLFRERFAPGGLYLMDEPEAALSPQSQLALVALMADAVRAGGQFIVATHSPILLAIPGSVRLSFDSSPLSTVAWEELDSVRLWQDLLAGPDRFMRHIWQDVE
ncbi:MAG: AAA family ATPase [Gemmatimonadales bacterium]|nr:MAG: AAA family ATPase [Gemmatimonadales bacterium]